MWRKIKYEFTLVIALATIAPFAVAQPQTVAEEDQPFDHFPEFSDYDLIADRMSCLQETIPLNFNNRVFGFVKYFAEKDRDYTRMVIDRATYYFPIFEYYLQKHGLPDEIKYLSIIESGLNPRAISRVGAVGLWQFMPYTGREYKLHQDWYIDERMDPYKATEAACIYLKRLYGMFNDWELAMAAYNTGPGNVRKAIRRSGYKKKFWEIYRYLPRETRSYVPQWAAIMYVMNYAEEHNFIEPQREYQMAYDTVMVDKFADLKIVASHLNLCEDDLTKLNPAIKHSALPDTKRSYAFRLPKDVKPYFTTHRDSILTAAKAGKSRIEYKARNSVGSTYGRDRIVYRVKSGDVLGTIAQRYKVRVSDLRNWNNIRGNIIRVGQRLNIWLYPDRKRKILAAANAKPKPTPIINLDGKKVYQVQPGDTLWDISRKFNGLTIEKIKKLNNLSGNKIKPGQKLIIG